jgi:hypothetical protein
MGLFPKVFDAGSRWQASPWLQEAELAPARSHETELPYRFGLWSDSTLFCDGNTSLAAEGLDLIASREVCQRSARPCLRNADY